MSDFNWDVYFDLMEKDLFDANKYRHSFVPPKLYKVFPPNIIQKRIRTLRNCEMWMSAIGLLNDPFEFSAYFYPNFPPEYIDKMKDDLAASYYIAALSNNSFSSPIMWAHYAENHHGFCVEYRVNNPDYIWNVHYSHKRLKFEKGLCKAIKKTSEQNLYNYELGLFMQQLFYKSDEWKYEREYRAVVPVDFIPDGNCYGGIISLSRIGLEATAIIAGMNSSEALIKKLKKSADILQCDFFRTTLSRTDFRMERIT